MPKLDEYKEILNTLRVSVSLSFGILVLIITGLIKRYDSSHVDLFFWAGIIFAFIVLLVIFKLYLKISRVTKRIGDL